jgi:2-methylcitrate dehydratase PrpD
MAALSRYMSEAKDRPLPDLVVEKAKQHTIDTLAAMISGAELVPGHAAIRFAREYGGAQVATVAASTIVCGPMEAALVNGVLAHADETDDSWPSGWHPGCAVVPAALAVGERFGINGPHLLRAVALGYDIGSRMLITLREAGPLTHKSTHSIAGIWGAAAAAGCAASLNPQQMRWLIDYTAQQASGIAAWSRDSEHVEKGFAFGGMPARSGVTSALLVRSGWTGINDVLSGENNYIIANAPQADPARLPTELLIEKLGERFEVAGTNLKKWSVGSPLQQPLDAIETMLKKRPFEAAQVKEVVVRAAPGSFTDWADMPDINLRHMIAVMLMDKTVTFKSSHDVARMKDPEILRHRAKVRFVPGRGPEQGGTQPLVEITLVDGTRLAEDNTTVRGRIDNPMTRDEVIAKCQALNAPVLGEATGKRLIETLFQAESLKDVRELRPLLQRA